MTESHARSSKKRLALEIARCAVVEAVLRADPAAAACRAVVEYQRCEPALRWVPEPWSGHLAEAAILLVSSNPGSGKPNDSHSLDQITASSSDDEILHSFDDAFDDGPWPGVADGVYLRDRDGIRGKYVRYWGWAMSIAEELLQRPPRPGLDYALTELVHCSSRDEVGVWDAVTDCVPRYFERVMATAPAPVVLVVGAVAREMVRVTYPELNPVDGRVVTGVLGGRNRLIAYGPHPSAF